MPISKDMSKKGKITFALQDFTSDSEYNVFFAEDLTGKCVPVDLWCYARYFYDKIQYKSLSKEMVYVDGIRLEKFIPFFIKEKQFSNFEEYIKESTCFGFQQEMEEKYGVHINWIALYGLCMYIKEIINRRLVVLFKPTIKETIDELICKGGFSSVTFESNNGVLHTTNNCLTIDTITKALQNSNDETYVFDKIARKVDVYSKEYGQIEFVRYISHFFHDFFEIKRRKNSYLTITEQRIICCFLKFFGFAPEIVQESRFRQLFSSKYKPVDHLLPLNIPEFFESNIYVYFELLSYSDWKNGRINPLTRKMTNEKENISINMGESPDVSELLKVMEGLL